MNGPAAEPPGALPAAATGLSARRQVAGGVAAVVGLPLVTVALAGRRDDVLLSTPVLLMLAVVVCVALIGGMRPALPAAIAGFLLLNFVYTEPYGTFDVHRLDQGLALAVYAATAVAVSVVVDLAARRHSQAVRASAEAAELSALAGVQAGVHEDLHELLTRVREVFGLRSAAVVELRDDTWEVVAESGTPDADGTGLRLDVSARRAMHVTGRTLSADDRRVLAAFARAAVAGLEQQDLAQQAAEADRLASIDQLRTALLAGVGHDLRTPLTGIKAAASSLRAADVEWSDAERDELLEVIEDSADRLDALVANLLAASRLDAGAVSVTLLPTDVEEIIGRGVHGLSDSHRVVVDLPEQVPLVLADVGLAERIVANVVDNALRYSGRGTNVLVTAAPRGSDVVLSVVDTGPGVPPAEREALFTPYQRVGDRAPGGLGLGLSVAHGFASAMGGTLAATDTPGGGLTMTLRLRAVGR